MHSFIAYAVRLGYTEELAQEAVERLGEDAITNDLLTLLISLQSVSMARENDYRHALKIKTKQTKKFTKRRCLGFKESTLSYANVMES